MLTIRAMSSGAGYAGQHLEHADYYAEGERIVGQWQGRGAAQLGLSGEVTREQFEAVRQGLHPETGEFLRPRQSADRYDIDGQRSSQGRHLYDFTFSAPKSVSVLALLGPDDRLVDAHEQAVNEALDELERSAAARVRLHGANENRPTGNLVVAVYHHDTSRELDPQLHTHAVAANLTYDGAEGRWKALQASEIYERRAFLTEVYRNALAREVRARGYEIDDQRDTRGRDIGFEIRGVPRDLVETYSRRSVQRDRAVDAFTERTSRRPTDNEVAVLVRESRSDKLTEISTAEVRERQQARLSVDGAQRLTALRDQAVAHGRQEVTLERAARSLEYAEAHVFERVSVARDHQVLTEALRHGRGRIAIDELKGRLHVEEVSRHILRGGHDITSRESLAREQQMVATIDRGVGRFGPLRSGHDFVPSDRLAPEQREAVLGVLASRDLAVNLRGAAGTGKTRTLQEVHRGLTEGGREVVAVAPTRSAVDELQRAGLSNATTIQQLLQDPQGQTRLSGAVVVIDEAGMVSGRQMESLLHLAERQGARVIFSGDTKQLQSVEASDALRILERDSRLQSVSLTHVERQTVHAYREAIETMRDDAVRGLQQLERMGAVIEVAWADRARTVADVWRQAQLQLNDRGERSSVLIVCPTHTEIGAVTDAVRANLRAAGELGPGKNLERLESLQYTLPQKQELRGMQPGHVLVFHRATGEFKRGEAAEVIDADRHRVTVRRPNGEERGVTGGQAAGFDVFQRRSIEIAPNDRLLLTANHRDPDCRITNGELVTVSRVDEAGRLFLSDGRTLPADYQHFNHGYAITAHRSQGKTVDRVVISGDELDRRLFYVAASRGREQVTIVTSNRERLEASLGRSGDRPSASELARRTLEAPRPEMVQTEARGVGRAVSMAHDAAVRQGEDVGRGTDGTDRLIEQRRGQQNRPELAPTSIQRGHGIGFSR
jgi:conjugative relaxase-like TrwC/TraI family protein